MQHPTDGEQYAILLIQPDKATRRMMELMLRLTAYRLLVADSPQAGLDLLRAEHRPVHLLITEYALPTMTGREFAEFAQHIRPSLKILLLCAGTVGDPQRIGYRLLGKPFNSTALLDAVEQALAK